MEALKQWFQSLNNEAKASVVTLIFMIWFIAVLACIIMFPIIEAVLCSMMLVVIITGVVWCSMYCLFEYLDD